MDNREKELFFENFNNSLHRIGRITMILSLILLLSVPVMVCVFNGATFQPGFLKGIAPLAVFIIMSVGEFLIYTPMLGVGGSYLSFLTGNVTNMKIPCALNARDIAKTEAGTPENEIVSTLSIATSAIVTTIVVALGVVLIAPFQSLLDNPVLAPAFDADIVVAALFGALGLKYFAKSPKIAVIPLVLVSVLCIVVPSMIASKTDLMIPCGLLALAIAFVLFKKGKI